MSKTLTDFEFVQLATSQDPFRRLLCGVLDTGNNLLATDTHRLHVVERPNAERLADKSCLFTTTSTNARCRKEIEGYQPDWETERYPAWERVIPKNWRDADANWHLTVKVTPMLVQFLKRMLSLSNEYNNLNRLQVTTDVKSQTLQCRLPDTGSMELPVVSFDIPAVVEADFKFAINLGYLYDALRGVVESYQHNEVKMIFDREWVQYDSGYKRPIVFTNNKDRYAVVMVMEYSA